MTDNEINTEIAKAVVLAVLQELHGRRGFDWWWGDVLSGDKDDIIKCAAERVAKVLQSSK